MELLYVNYARGGKRSTFYFVPIGDNGGRLAGLASDTLTDPEIKMLRRNAKELDEMSGAERYEWLMDMQIW